jgi:hypothetical protein
MLVLGEMVAIEAVLDHRCREPMHLGQRLEFLSRRTDDVDPGKPFRTSDTVLHTHYAAVTSDSRSR